MPAQVVKSHGSEQERKESKVLHILCYYVNQFSMETYCGCMTKCREGIYSMQMSEIIGWDSRI